jgi:autotransporter translocation and assembly factor TamB
VSGSLPTVRNLNFRARINEQRVSLEEASVMLAGGRLRLEGGAGLDRPTDPVLDLRLTADEVLVIRDENLSLRANAGITCRGPVSKAEVRGQVDLVRGRVFKEIEFLPLSLPNDLPPPPPATTLARQGPPALPAPFDQWNFDIDIRTRDPVRLMGNVARGNAVADLKLAGPGAKPELTGKIRLEEMRVRLPFSRLNITDGALTFVKDQPFDPQIDITGESIIGSRMVQVFVQGRALDPRVRLTSSPPLPEGEIAALLATGVTTSDLTSNRDEAAGRAAFVLLRQTYRRLFRKADTIIDDDEPPRLTFDFSVFGTDPSRRGVSAIYELNPRWRIIGRVGETGTFRGLLHYLIRFR